MSEDPKTKLLSELITREVVMPTKHQNQSAAPQSLRRKSHTATSSPVQEGFAGASCYPPHREAVPWKWERVTWSVLSSLRNVLYAYELSCPSLSVSYRVLRVPLWAWFTSGSVCHGGIAACARSCRKGWAQDRPRGWGRSKLGTCWEGRSCRAPKGCNCTWLSSQLPDAWQKEKLAQHFSRVVLHG